MVPPRSGSAMGMRTRGPVELNINLSKTYEMRGPKSPLKSPLLSPMLKSPMLLSPMPRSPLRDVTHEERGGGGGGRASYEDRLEGALHVLRTEANALAALTQLYASERVCRDGFHRAVEALVRHRDHRGKVVFIGVGKSGWIAKKLTATFSSLGLPAVFLHPTEALHGDLGVVGDHDTLVMITFSGRTPELLLLLPHLSRKCPLVLLTAPTSMDTCEIARHRPDLILLPAPIPVAEKETFGVSAPTTSTTMAIAVGDALAYVASKEMYPSVSAVFAKNHPGGAIGQAFKTK